MITKWMQGTSLPADGKPIVRMLTTKYSDYELVLLIEADAVHQSVTGDPCVNLTPPVARALAADLLARAEHVDPTRPTTAAPTAETGA